MLIMLGCDDVPGRVGGRNEASAVKSVAMCFDISERLAPVANRRVTKKWRAYTVTFISSPNPSISLSLSRHRLPVIRIHSLSDLIACSPLPALLSNGSGRREAVQNLIRLRILSNSWPTRLKPTQPPPLRLTLPSPSGFFRPPSLSALHSVAPVARLRPIGRPPAHAQRPPHCFAARFPPSQIRNCPRLCQCTQGACPRCCRTVSPYRRRSIPLVHTTERRYSNWLQRQTETA